MIKGPIPPANDKSIVDSLIDTVPGPALEKATVILDKDPVN